MGKFLKNLFCTTKPDIGSYAVDKKDWDRFAQILELEYPETCWIRYNSDGKQVEGGHKPTEWNPFMEEPKLSKIIMHYENFTPSSSSGVFQYSSNGIFHYSSFASAQRHEVKLDKTWVPAQALLKKHAPKPPVDLEF